MSKVLSAFGRLIVFDDLPRQFPKIFFLLVAKQIRTRQPEFGGGLLGQGSRREKRFTLTFLALSRNVTPNYVKNSIFHGFDRF